MFVRNLLFLSLILTCLKQPERVLGQNSNTQSSEETFLSLKPADFNRRIYFKHKLEFSLDTGWLPKNIPFIFNPLMGEKWAQTPLDYTLVPAILSLRWHWGGHRGSLVYSRQYRSLVQWILHSDSARA